MLALLVKSDETDLLNNIWTSADTIILTVYDPDAEVYQWLKVFSDVRNETYYEQFVYFTADGTKILIAQFIDQTRSMVYLNAESGSVIAGTQ